MHFDVGVDRHAVPYGEDNIAPRRVGGAPLLAAGPASLAYRTVSEAGEGGMDPERSAATWDAPSCFA